MVNDAGHGAIAYCVTDSNREIAGAYVMPLTGTVGTPVRISTQCDVMDATTFAFQRHRAFDIAIDKNSKLYTVGILDNGTQATPPSTFGIAAKTHTAGTWTSLTSPTSLTTVPGSLMLSLDNDGVYGAIAWSQIDPATSKANVFRQHAG